ncbi:hypothetical protein MTR_4g116230 [Medicago truncatula]|uniref:Uncharacterized protein n=1 Tax=Medicago truncatula TaxID=3880 RepID=G7JGM4_MEDTR|nr:hypothetical protein MTR_4g116230 [Medicago truncatula]
MESDISAERLGSVCSFNAFPSSDLGEAPTIVDALRLCLDNLELMVRNGTKWNGAEQNGTE